MASDYLKEILGKYLPRALREVAFRRPERPIEFLANRLISLYEEDLEHHPAELPVDSKKIIEEVDEETFKQGRLSSSTSGEEDSPQQESKAVTSMPHMFAKKLSMAQDLQQPKSETVFMSSKMPKEDSEVASPKEASKSDDSTKTQSSAEASKPEDFANSQYSALTFKDSTKVESIPATSKSEDSAKAESSAAVSESDDYTEPQSSTTASKSEDSSKAQSSAAGTKSQIFVTKPSSEKNSDKVSSGKDSSRLSDLKLVGSAKSSISMEEPVTEEEEEKYGTTDPFLARRPSKTMREKRGSIGGWD